MKNNRGILFGILILYVLFYTLLNINVANIKAQTYNITPNNNIKETVNISYDSNTLDLLYDKSLDEVSMLMKKLKLKNSIEVLYAFNYLLDNGYLTVNEAVFTEDDNEVLDLSDRELLGIDVLYGKMNCRHISDFFTKLLVKLGYDAYTIPVFITTNKYDKSDIPNHAITMVNDENIIYIDATNNIILDKYNKDYLSDKKENCYATVMAQYSLIEKQVVISHNSYNDLMYINKLYNDDTNYLNDNYIIKQYNNSANKIIGNMNIIKDFKNKYKSSILDKLPNKESI